MAGVMDRTVVLTNHVAQDRPRHVQATRVVKETVEVAVIQAHGHVMELPLIKPQKICLSPYGVSLNNAGYGRGGNTQVEIAVATHQH